MKNIMILMILAFVFMGCSSVREVSKTVMPLPKKCGIYMIHYELADTNSSIMKYDKSIYESHKDEVLLYGISIWYQTIGGLLYPDGRDAGSYTLKNVDVQLIEVVKEGKIDNGNLVRKCNKMKGI